MDVGVDALLLTARVVAGNERLWTGEGLALVVHGEREPSADRVPVMRLVDLAQLSVTTDSLARRSTFGGLSRMFSLRV